MSSLVLVVGMFGNLRSTDETAFRVGFLDVTEGHAAESQHCKGRECRGAL